MMAGIKMVHVPYRGFPRHQRRIFEALLARPRPQNRWITGGLLRTARKQHGNSGAGPLQIMGHARPGMKIGDDGKPIETLLANNGPSHTPEALVTRCTVKAKRQPNGPPRGRGRPSEYTDAIAERLCEALASGQ